MAPLQEQLFVCCVGKRINWQAVTWQGMEWVWEVLKLALAPGMPAGADLPRAVYLEDLEHVRLKRWMCFGAALAITDR